MSLSKKQMISERDDIINDLFGIKSDKNNIGNHIKSLTSNEKVEILSKIDNHIKFYKNITDENHEKDSLRIEFARLRVEKIYPQLIKALS